jgi:hypothetical protein
MSLWKSHPICSLTPFLSKLIFNPCLGKKVAKNVGLFCHFQKMPKASNCPLGKNSQDSMLDLTEQTCVNDWMYLQMRGIFLYTLQTKEVHQKHGNGLYKKILEWTGTGEWTNIDKQLCVVMGGRLSIGEFYNTPNLVILARRKLCAYATALGIYFPARTKTHLKNCPRVWLMRSENVKSKEMYLKWKN